MEVFATIGRPIEYELLVADSDADRHEIAHATVAPAATDSARVAVSDRRALAQTARQIAHVCRAFVLVVTVLGALAFGPDAIASNTHPALTPALCSILDCSEDAPLRWVASVLGALLVVVAHYGREVTPSGYVVAGSLGARVAIVAHDAFAEVLSANAVHTDAGKTVVGAVRSVLDRPTHTTTGSRTAKLPGAQIVVGWADDAFTLVEFAPLIDISKAPDERNQDQSAYA
jgi:hypothetical protein